MKEIQPGLIIEIEREVTRDESAQTLGSGTLDVFGTPAMALRVEQACLELVDDYLEEGQTTVGVKLQLSHLAPTPLADKVRVKAEIIAIEKHIIEFKAMIWDSAELIGEAKHKRAIIDIQRFQRRVDKKAFNLPRS